MTGTGEAGFGTGLTAGIDDGLTALRAGTLTTGAARELAAWRYAPPYDCYDFPPWPQMVAQRWAITDPGRLGEFTAVRRGQDLVGWYWLRRVDGTVVLGCGLRPDACGRGAGGALLGLVARTAAEAFPGEPVHLTVRPFNARAIRAYEKAGFVVVARDEDRIAMRLAAEREA